MKKNKILIIIILFITIFATSYSEKLNGNSTNEVNSFYILEKGKQYMRGSILSQKVDRDGFSGSSQYIEYTQGVQDFNSASDFNGYKAKTKGFILGTTSIFNKTPDSEWITGVTFGYLNTDINYDDSSEDDEMGTMGVNAYLGYEHSGYFLMGYTGVGMGDSDEAGDRNNFTGGLELGKFIQVGDRNVIYPYISGTLMRNFMDDYRDGTREYSSNIENYRKYNIGMDYLIDFTKYFIKLSVEYAENHGEDSNEVNVKESGIEREVRGFDLSENGINAGITLGYYIEEDLFVGLDILNSNTGDENTLLTGLRIGHTF